MHCAHFQNIVFATQKKNNIHIFVLPNNILADWVCLFISMIFDYAMFRLCILEDLFFVYKLQNKRQY